MSTKLKSYRPGPVTRNGPVTLLMTATVAPPPGTPDLARSDPEVRMNDYKEALEFYLSVSDSAVDHILFVDNSDSDLSALEKIVERSGTKKKVELISFRGNDHPPSYGKGYGEFRLMDYALSHSKELTENKQIWKVTGRLRVLNLASMIRKAPTKFDVYCDLRDVPLIGHRLGANQWMELRLWAFSRRTYDRVFKGVYKELPYERCLQSPEQYLFTLLKRNVELHLIPRFNHQPKLDGYGGHMNVNYRTGGYLAKELLRTATRRIAPFIWL